MHVHRVEAVVEELLSMLELVAACSQLGMTFDERENALDVTVDIDDIAVDK